MNRLPARRERGPAEHQASARRGEVGVPWRDRQYPQPVPRGGWLDPSRSIGARRAWDILTESRTLPRAELPENLVEHAQQECGVRLCEIQPADEAADFYFCSAGGVSFYIAAGAESIQQSPG